MEPVTRRCMIPVLLDARIARALHGLNLKGCAQ